MGLVDGKESEPPDTRNALQSGDQRVIRRQALWGYVQQLGTNTGCGRVEFAGQGAQLAKDVSPLTTAYVGAQRARPLAGITQGLDLLFHQREQR